MRESSHADIWKGNVLALNKTSPEMRGTDSSGYGCEELREVGKEQETGNRKELEPIRWHFPYPAETSGSILSGKDFEEKNKI